MKNPPGKHNGAHVPWQRVSGTEQEGCPCIKADDERIAEMDADMKAAEDEEESMRLRMLALEKALWGKTFEGCLTIDRPEIRKLCDSEECGDAPLSLDKKRRVD